MDARLGGAMGLRVPVPGGRSEHRLRLGHVELERPVPAVLRAGLAGRRLHPRVPLLHAAAEHRFVRCLPRAAARPVEPQRPLAHGRVLPRLHPADEAAGHRNVGRDPRVRRHRRGAGRTRPLRLRRAGRAAELGQLLRPLHRPGQRPQAPAGRGEVHGRPGRGRLPQHVPGVQRSPGPPSGPLRAERPAGLPRERLGHDVRHRLEPRSVPGRGGPGHGGGGVRRAGRDPA